jgi:hypothetical protein
MAQPAPDSDEQQRLRIGTRTYTDDSGPLVEVLLLLHDWARERRQREAKAQADNATAQD